MLNLDHKSQVLVLAAACLLAGVSPVLALDDAKLSKPLDVRPSVQKRLVGAKGKGQLLQELNEFLPTSR